MRTVPLASLLAALTLSACTVYDDIAIDVVVPLAVQEEFVDVWPGKYLRPVMMFDEQVASLGVECELAVTEQTYFARYLQAGCYDEHHIDIYLTALDVEAGVPCAHDFQLDQGGRDLPSYEPSLSFDIPVTKNGRCGSEWKWFELVVDELWVPADEALPVE